MAFININSTDCLTTSRLIINQNSANFDNRLIQTQNGYNQILITNDLLSNQALRTNNVLQKVQSVYLSPGQIPAFNFINETIITTSIVKKPSSKLLIELTGGRYTTVHNAGFLTYFYVRLGNSTSFNNAFSSPVEFVRQSSGSGSYDSNQHRARALYSDSNTNIQIMVYTQKYITTANTVELWNVPITDAPTIPIVLSLTELAG